MATFGKKRPLASDAAVQPLSKKPKSDSRNFKDCWLQEFKWLEYKAESKQMFCKICVQCQKYNSFTSGCNMLKKDNISKHEKSKDHKDAVQASELKRTMSSMQTTAVKKSETAVLSAMKNVYFAAKNNLASSLIPELNRLCISHGVDQFSMLRSDAHTTYEHHSSIAEFQNCMADVLRDDLRDKIVKCGKFSIMIDESTDVSVRQNLVTYVRLLESDVFGNFESKTYFLSIDELDRANAESIYCKVTAMLKEKGLNIQNLCSISTDGASVMVGKNSGVVTRLKNQIPGVLATHCIAHRLALSCAGGADTVPYLVKYQEILNSIYKFFQYSPKNMSTLLAIQKVIQSKTQKCKEVFHTRWLSFEGSVDALLTNYSSLVSVFLEQTSGKALSLYKPITCYKFLHVSHFLADCLGPLAILSKTFQKQDLSFSEIHPLLTATIDTLAEIKDGKSGDSLSNFIAQVPAEPTTDSDGLCTFEFQGHTIRDGANQRTAAVEVCKKFVENMLASLNERFSDNADSAILTALTNFFNPELPDSEMNGNLDALIDYSETLGLEGTKHELRAFSKFCRTSYESGNKSVKNINSACNLALRNKEIYPFCAELASRLLVAPVATADCERGFSKQNLIKTHLRNSLKIQNLNNLMTLAIDGPAVENFDFKRAFEKWAGLKSRRILN